MWHLYMDESSDLGFDFTDKQPSKFFTVTIISIRGAAANRTLTKAARRTLRRKLSPHHQKGRDFRELKGSSTSISVKKYFYSLVEDVEFGIYALTIDKQRILEKVSFDREKIYNEATRHVLEKIPLEEKNIRVQLIIDRSKTRREVRKFNSLVVRHLCERLGRGSPIDIFHRPSESERGLQVADLFCWGIFRKYERTDSEWFDVYRKKVIYERVIP